MEGNARPSRGFVSPDCLQILSMKDFLEEADGGSSCDPICKHCQKNYEHKDMIVWFETTCLKVYCEKCGNELISNIKKTLAGYGSFLGFKVYKLKFQMQPVSCNIEKLQREGPSKQNSICSLCNVECESGTRLLMCKVVCEDGNCCPDCRKAKCFLLWKVMKDSAPALQVRMFKEEVCGGGHGVRLGVVEEEHGSDGEKTAQPAQYPPTKIMCSCCNSIFTCTNWKEGNKPCQGTCFCCTQYSVDGSARTRRKKTEAEAEDPEIHDLCEVIKKEML